MSKKRRENNNYSAASMWNHMQCIHNSHRNWDEFKGMKRRMALWHIRPYWPKMFINSVGLFIFLLAWLCNAAKIGETDSALGLVFFWIIRGWLERFLWNVFDLKVFDLIFRSLGWGIFLSSCGTKTNLNRQRVFKMCGSVRQFLWQIDVSKVSQVRVYNQSRRHNLIRWL